MPYTLPSGPRGDSPSDRGRRPSKPKPKKKGGSVGAAIQQAGSKPAPQPSTPKPGARSTGKTIQRTGKRIPAVFKPGGGSGRPSPSSKPKTSGAFSRGGLQSPNFGDARREARDAVRDVRTDAVRSGRMRGLELPMRPVLEDGYTEDQRSSIIRDTEEAIQDAIKARGSAREKLNLVNALDETNGPSELRRLGDRDTRRALNKYIGAIDTRKTGWVDEQFDSALDRAKGASINGKVYTRPDVDRLSRPEKVQIFNDAQANYMANSTSEAKPGRGKLEVQAMGVNIPVEAGIQGFIDQASKGAPPSVRGALNLAYIVPTQTARATVEDPAKAAEVNAKFIGQTALGLITTPASMAIDVAQGKPVADVAKDTGKAMVDEYKQFYGPAAQGNAAGFRKNVSESGGAARVGLDALSVAVPAGKAAGLTAKTGALGARLESAVTSPRANLRYSLGSDAVKVQRTESSKAVPNLFRALAQQGVDNARRGAEDRRVQRARRAANGEQTRGDRLATLFGASDTMPVVRARGGTRKAPEAGGEVTPFWGVTGRRMQRRAVARRKNQSVDEIRETQDKLIRDSRDATKGLSRRETAAWGYLHRGLVGAGDGTTVYRTAGSRPDTIAHLKRRRQQILDNRKAANYTPTKFRLARDELAVLDDLIANVDEAFSPKAVAAAERTRAIERASAEIDPDLPVARAELRRVAQQAATLGIKRNVVTEKELKAARATLHAEARKEVERARRDYEKELVGAGVAQGRAEVLSRNVGGVAAERMAERAGNPRARTDGSYAGGGIGAAAGKKAVQEAQRRLEDAIVREKEARAARTKKAISEASAASRETDAEYLARVREAAAAEGLPEAGYIPSRGMFQARLSDSAAGGSTAVRGHGKYSGDLFSLGKEVISPAVFEQGLRRNVKLNVNWRLVADQFDEHAHPTLRDMPAKKLIERADELGLDPDEYGVYLPGRFRTAAARHADDDLTVEDARGADPDIPKGPAAAVSEGTVQSLGELQRALDAGDLAPTSKATLVARGAFDEIMATTRPQGAAMRAANIARSKATRILFAFNPVWFAANTVGAAVPAFMRGVSPKAFIDAQLYFKGLHKRDPSAHTALRRELGIGHQRLQDVQQPRMGGAADRVPVFGGMVKAWQAYRNTPMGQKLRPFSRSIDAWLGLEQRVNSDTFRRALFHTEARREAFRRIDAEAGAANAIMERLTSIAKPGGSSKRLQAKIDEIVKERQQIETLGQKTANILGDWQTFTAAERNAMGLIFLYPYLRYSLKFLFATMPVHHPVMLNVLAQMAQLNAGEIHELLHGEELPYQMGKVYFTKDGKVQEVEVGKVNPAANTITEAKDWRLVFGLLPPWYQMALEQTLDYNIFAGREWRYEGYPDKSKDKPELGMFSATRGRIILKDLLEMFPPTREWSRQTLTGFQGDDSLPWDPRPVKYKSDELKKLAVQMKREQSEGGFWTQLIRHQAFLLPKPSRDPGAAKARAEEKKPKPAAGNAGSWGIGGSGGWGIR